MTRIAAISGELVGARGLWMGRTQVAPATSSGPHHHGYSETGIFVVSGHPVFLYREGDRVIEVPTAPGDFIYVPPFVPHIESNPAPHEEAVVVVTRTTQEAIVVNLEGL
jgi:uncharacterized RmlC-like cupin family protein